MKYNQETIEDYLLHRLSKAEEAAFEEAMRDDKDLREEVEIMRHIVIAFQRKGEQKALDAIRKSSGSEIRKLIGASEPQQEEVPKYRLETIKPAVSYSPAASKRSGILPLLVSLTAVAAIAILVYIGFSPQYPEHQLFGEYYTAEVYETSPSRGEPNEEQERMTSALNLAIGRLNKHEAREAVDALKSLASSDTFDYREEAQWYLALAYLQNEQKDEAKEMLAVIIKEKGTYQSKALELLNKLNEKKWF